MGLLDATYVFDDPTPTYEELVGKVVELAGRPIRSELRDLTNQCGTGEEIRRQNPLPSGRTTLLSNVTITFWDANRLHVEVTRSIHGHEPYMFGNSTVLLDLLGRAAVALGGRKNR